MEEWIERDESDEREKKNVIIRGTEVKEGRRRRQWKIIKIIGEEFKVEEVWRIAGDKEKGREMMEMRVEEKKKRRKIWGKKKTLRGRKERIMEDWIWEEIG